ncbi:MAG: hypothetical protein IJB97_09400, partial [Clostridia bacterium]|nr:hypothetical protein [Clostridia bacterium]
HKLPDNCIVIAAGNRVTDKSVAFKMPKALANRLCHIEVTGGFDSWRKWAIENAIHEKVVGFLSFRADYLMSFDSSGDDLAFATPRSWEMVSNLLVNVNADVDKIYPLVAGCVGTGIAVEFRSWCKIYDSLPSVKDIFDGKNPPLPLGTDALYALISSMTAYAREHKDDARGITNSIRYGMKMPSDFSTVLLKNYMAIEKNYREKLMKIPEFYQWIQTKGKLLNGNI